MAIFPILSASPTPATPPQNFNSLTREFANRNATFPLLVSADVTGPIVTKVMGLPDVLGVNRAYLVLEAATGATPGAVLARLWQDGDYPTPTAGLPLKDGSVIEISCALDIQRLRIITADDLPHIIQVQYFQ